jgi:hypothetical protein
LVTEREVELLKQFLVHFSIAAVKVLFQAKMVISLHLGNLLSIPIYLGWFDCDVEETTSDAFIIIRCYTDFTVSVLPSEGLWPK